VDGSRRPGGEVVGPLSALLSLTVRPVSGWVRPPLGRAARRLTGATLCIFPGRRLCTPFASIASTSDGASPRLASLSLVRSSVLEGGCGGSGEVTFVEFGSRGSCCSEMASATAWSGSLSGCSSQRRSVFLCVV
jgi:hypothetical protein